MTDLSETPTRIAADGSDEASARGGSVLVVGADAADAHSRTCRALAAEDRHRFRGLLGDDEADACADTTDWYDDGVFEGMTPSQLGIAVTDAVANVAPVGDAPDCHVCLDGVPPVRGRESERRLFRFLHVLTRRLDDGVGGCHVHLDDREFARTVAPLFDRVVDLDD